ncbi:lytic murein transglycosylase [Roseovarius pelagicus]|uniref:Lytic murein transglycosylase n=1 Tax=Roseovarius pelagicus TaxID=2980108 RepID=A0ABY6D917_9RHOB|nr:lytic murein transglycosylase [Roseovarius pelagicus]UXX82634.1 lytic murein transglycosylase [Roseovarius pelagicus]
MRTGFLWAVTVGLAVFQGSATYATEVETSLRPQLRPEGLGEIVARQAVSETVLASAVRPVLRPANLKETPIVQVSTSNRGFDQWIKGFRGRAGAAGIQSGVFDRAFHGIQYDASVVKLDRNQSEFTKQIWEYLDSAVSPTRITNGKRELRRQRKTLDRIEAHFGVDKEIVTAIWGMESAYGARRGDRPLIQSLATLAYDGRRGRFFEGQLIAALKIIQAGDVAPRKMTGSWAGAMGHTQFIPTSYLAYAVDFTGDGKRDIWSDDPTDALASTAAYLARFGWKKNQPWGVEVKLPGGFDPARARRSLKQAPSAWAAEGIRDMRGKPVPNYGAASILLPAGTQGAAFMIFHNFGVIEKYNKADAYVIGVGHLADRLKGGPAIQASWPRQYQSTTIKQKKEIQRQLKRKGYNVQAIDGKIGPKTIGAIRKFQKSRGLPPDGYPSRQLLKELRGS